MVALATYQKKPVENQPRYVPAHHWEAVNMTKAGSIAPGVNDRWGFWGAGRLLGNGEMFQLIYILVGMCI